MKKKIVCMLFPFIFICACKTAKKASVDVSPNIELVNDPTYRKLLTDKELFRATTEIVPLDTVYVVKDTLNIITKKITGCETSNFKLVWNNDLGKAIPAQTTVKLLEYLPADCKQKHKFHLTYNITPLKLKNDTSEIKTTLIYVGGWKRLIGYVHDTPDSLLTKK